MKHLKLCIILILYVYTSLQTTTQKSHLSTDWYPNKKESLQSTIAELSKTATVLYVMKKSINFH